MRRRIPLRRWFELLLAVRRVGYGAVVIVHDPFDENRREVVKMCRFVKVRIKGRPFLSLVK